MQVKCAICDNIEGIDHYSLQAKRLRNRKVNLFLCDKCYERIGQKTTERHETGKFKLYKEKKKNNGLF